MMRMATRWFVLAVLAGTMSMASQAEAGQILYATSLEGQRIDKVDVGINTDTTVANLPEQADSLVFVTPTQIVYTGINDGTLHLLDLTAHTNTTIATGLNGPRDLALEPGGGSVLVSDYSNSRIVRVDLATHIASTLRSGFNPDGIVYTPTGSLFVVSNRNELLQLNPVTGATIHSRIFGTNNLDGLTYDSFTGKLIVGDFNGHVNLIDPSNIGSNPITQFNAPGGTDGIGSDGLGTLYIASRGDSHIYSLDLTNGSVTQRTFVQGLDDLAPVTGLGAPAVPEPATVVSGLLGLGLAGLYARRRRRTAV